MEKVKVKEITKYYGRGENEFAVVNNVSFSINKGEFVTVLGPSGSGKTTLLKCVCGIETVKSGEIWIGGKDIIKLTEEERKKFRRKNIGIVFQQYSLLPILNVRENILLPLKLNRDRMDKEYFDEIIEMLGIQDKMRNRIDTLSGGQQQRVAIARGLITKPQLICADEPTGNLDRANSNEVIQLFKKIRKEFHTSVLMITHDEQIAKESDNTIKIEDGKIVKENVNDKITC